MQTVETSQLFKEFFATKPKTTVERIQGMVERPEVYDYEQQIGKKLMDMNEDELFEMISGFHYSRGNSKKDILLSPASYDVIINQYRDLWNYYIDHYEIIKNPWYSRNMRGKIIAERLSKNTVLFTKEQYEDFIKFIQNYEIEKANYIECIVRLFHDGFASPKDILNMKEHMIDFKQMIVHIDDKRIIHLEKRTMELLQYVHRMEDLAVAFKQYKALPYHDSYFKFIVRVGKKDKDLSDEKFQNMFDQRKPDDVARRLAGYVSRTSSQSDITVNFTILYLYGMYDQCREKVGEERLVELLNAEQDRDMYAELYGLVEDYGLSQPRFSIVKRSLKQFIQS